MLIKNQGEENSPPPKIAHKKNCKRDIAKPISPCESWQNFTPICISIKAGNLPRIHGSQTGATQNSIYI